MLCICVQAVTRGIKCERGPLNMRVCSLNVFSSGAFCSRAPSAFFANRNYENDGGGVCVRAAALRSRSELFI